MQSKVDHNRQNKIALINDLTGFGRCSAAVQIPVISQLGVQCCLLPTSILSNHTGFADYSFFDFTDHMREHIDQWRSLGLRFKGICTGFLGSADQISIVRDFIDEFGSGRCCVMVDPVMGDNGKPYETYTSEMCARMTELVAHADIITPNLTEACILANVPYDAGISQAKALELAEALCEMGPGRVVVTGIEGTNSVMNACFERGREPFVVETARLGEQRSGTGDIFSAIISADAVNGVEFRQSVTKASKFVGECVAASIELGIPRTDGLAFEEKLHTLAK